MTSDLRILIFLNLALVLIAGYAAVSSYAKSLNDPKWYDKETIQKQIADGKPEETKAMIKFLSAGLENRVKATNSDRKRTAILSIFTAFVAGTNLWLIFWLYRKSRKGLFIKDSVMLETQ